MLLIIAHKFKVLWPHTIFYAARETSTHTHTHTTCIYNGDHSALIVLLSCVFCFVSKHLQMS